MPRYLVVANQTLGGERLMNAIRERIAAGPCSFYVLVPAKSLGITAMDKGVLGSYSAVGPGSSDIDRREEVLYQRAEATARSGLGKLIDQIRAAGATAEGDVGHSDPLVAIESAIDSGPFDEIIISTLPANVSRWLRLDVPHRVERRFKLPVTTVTAKA